MQSFMRKLAFTQKNPPISASRLWTGRLEKTFPVRNFRKEQYFALISVLFQDTTLLPTTLDYNLTSQEPEQIDRKRLEAVLKLSGIYEKYESLPEKGDTMLVKEVNC